MARLIPPKLSDAPRSEHHVHGLLASLPEPWVVIADVPMGLFGRPRPGMTQLDFLLIHRQHGLCVLEVKGGRVEVREGIWYTTPLGGPQAGRENEMRRSPFEQAATQRYELQRFLWRHIRVPDESMAHAVALPDCVVEAALGPNAPRGIILDRRDLESIEDSVLRAMKTWKTRADLTDEDVETIIGLLKPSNDLTVVLAAEVALTEAGLQRETRRQVQFTDSQVRVYQELLRHERVAVIGEAGTGKTVMAVERAQRLADTGLRTLLLCHRAAVAAFMRTAIGGQMRRVLDLREPSALTVIPYGEFLQLLAEESGRKRPGQVPSPEWVFAAADAIGVQFDALIVDEAQEFTMVQLEALLFLLSDPDESPVYLFADPFQHSATLTTTRPEDRREQRGRLNWRPPENLPIVALVDNVRNSRPIAEAVGQFLVEQRSVSRVQGPPPEVVICPRGEVIERGVERVCGLLNEGFHANQMLVVAVGIDKKVVMRVAKRASLDVLDVSAVARFPLPPADLRVAVGEPDDVQGLEAEVVVVLLRAGQLTVGDARDIYVAASRARSHLVLVGARSLAELQASARTALLNFDG